jgi:hypothetical protein
MPRSSSAIALGLVLLPGIALAQSPSPATKPQAEASKPQAEASKPQAEATKPEPEQVHSPREGARKLIVPVERGAWQFAIYGDRTGGPVSGLKVLERAVADTNLLDPDLVMTVGDLIPGYNQTPAWLAQAKRFKGIMGELSMPWYPVAGNHDVYWRGPKRPRGQHEQNYEQHFGPLWYWFAHKNAAFIVLYSDEGNPKTGRKGWNRPDLVKMSEAQLSWLSETLKETRALRHVFVFLHHPRWLSHYPIGNWARVHETLAKPGNVRAVFAGHIHHMRYDGRRDGIEYFTLATTGGHKGHDLPLAGYLHHLNLVTVRDEGIRSATIPVGAVIDPRSISGERVEQVTKLLRDLYPKTERPLLLKPGDLEPGPYICTVTNPSTLPIELSLTVEPGAGPWRLSPDHHHRRLAAGASVDLRFEVSLESGAAERAFELPVMKLQADVLDEQVRIRLPTKDHVMYAKLDLGEASAAPASRPNKALSLDGHGACLRVESKKLRAASSGSFTLEAWVSPDTLEGRRPLLAKTEGSGYAIFLDGGRASFMVHCGGRYARATAKKSLSLRRWQHIAGVYDKGKVKLYIDGVLAAEAPAPGARRSNKHPFYVGADPDERGRPVDALTGLVDEVRISSGARYQADSFAPQRRLSADAETLLLLSCDADYGPFVADRSSRGAHARRYGRARCVAVK